MKQPGLFPDPNKRTVKIRFTTEPRGDQTLFTARILGSWFVGHGFSKAKAAKAAIDNLKRAKGLL